MTKKCPKKPKNKLKGAFDTKKPKKKLKQNKNNAMGGTLVKKGGKNAKV